jgi:hypothetical protein
MARLASLDRATIAAISAFVIGILCGSTLAVIIGGSLHPSRHSAQPSAYDSVVFDQCLVQGRNETACEAYIRVLHRQAAGIEGKAAELLGNGKNAKNLIDWALANYPVEALRIYAYEHKLDLAHPEKADPFDLIGPPNPPP